MRTILTANENHCQTSVAEVRRPPGLSLEADEAEAGTQPRVTRLRGSFEARKLAPQYERRRRSSHLSHRSSAHSAKMATVPNFADFQTGLYLAGLGGDVPPYPLGFAGLEAAAREKMEHRLF